MNVRTFENELPEWLAAPMEDFEREFTYPLGELTRFRVSHGADYLRFFRSMGEAVCVVAEKEGRVLGTISGAIVSLSTSNGPKRALYVGDLKIAASARGTRVLFTLARAMEEWGRRRAEAAFSVVMDGTQVTPPMYTGRAGLPTFEPLASVAVLRIPVIAEETAGGDPHHAAPLDAAAGRIAHLGGNPPLRSLQQPAWLSVAPGASGRLEDTRRAKKLHADDGAEIVSAHLAVFVFEDAGAAARLLRLACGAARGVPAVFTSVDRSAAPEVLAALNSVAPRTAAGATIAAATVYGVGLPPGVPWVVNTSEI